MKALFDLCFFLLLAWILPVVASNNSKGFVDDIGPAIENAWNTSNAGVNVVASFPGTWPPEQLVPGISDFKTCRAPRVWFFLCGHYRSHYITQHSLRIMAEATAGSTASSVKKLGRSSCYMVAALMPDELDHNKKLSAVGSRGIQRFGQKWDQGLRGSGWNGPLRSSILLESSALGGRLAYAVVNRSGNANTFAGSFGLYWFGVWKVALWAAQVHNFSIDRHTVVVRTRPDVLFDRPFSINRIEDYFRVGPRGQHLVLGNENQCCQNDILIITSFGSYEDDIARPFAEAMHRARAAEPGTSDAAKFCYDLGLTNGWGYGRSIQNRAPWKGFDILSRGCVCLEDGKPNCLNPSCLVTTVESSYVYPRKKIFRSSSATTHDEAFASRLDGLLNQSYVDLADDIHIYCTAPKGRPSPSLREFERVAKSHWRLDRSFQHTGGSGFFRAINTSVLRLRKSIGNYGRNKDQSLWPPGCDASIEKGIEYSESPLPISLLGRF